MSKGISSSIRNRILAAVGALLLIVAAFAMFLHATNERIVEQNTSYLEGTTLQTSRRVDDLLNNAQSIVVSMAKTWELTMTEDQLNADRLREFMSGTPFDHLIYVESDGEAFDDRGIVVDAAQRDYYIEGIQGHTGACAIYNSSFDDENLITFYTPLYSDGEVIGVLVGAYTEDHISELLSTYFFGEQTSTFLVEGDGSIVASSATYPVTSQSVFGVFEGTRLNDTSIDVLREALAVNENMGFTFTTERGTSTGYLMTIDRNDWMILRTFPESVTGAMVTGATQAGVALMATIALAFAIFIIVLVVQAARQRKQLLLEKMQATRIIDASTNLFKRFVMLDYDRNTYDYLKAEDIDGGLRAQGAIETFAQYWREHVFDDDDLEVMTPILDHEKLQEILAPGIPYVQFEYRVVSPASEQPEWLRVSAIALARDSADRVTSVLYTIQDITEDKERDLASRAALEEAYRAADQASKAKSDFLNSMSHDIRTPMNSIMGLTAIATMHVNDAERVKDCLSKITLASRHLLGLINEVLDMAKIESGKLALAEEDFSLSETVESLLTIVHPQIAAKHQDLKVDISDIRHEEVVGDAMRLQQVFVNIMGNAVKFTPEGGTISLHISEKPSRIKESGCYQFVFSDTGCGMSEEFVQRVFEPFSRANDNRMTNVEGTGLGMSIVKNIINMMNGTIEVESVLGEGSVFTVTVYLKLREAEEHDLSELEGLRVLVADDDSDACEHACTMLQDIGMEPDAVLSGDEAVKAVRKASQDGNPYVAAILDWKMPGKSGLEVARDIRDTLSAELPIIILSAYDWSAIEEEARSVGVDAFVSKPLFRSRLTHVMRELLTDGAGDGTSEMVQLEECNCSGKRILLTEDNMLAASIAEDILGMTKADVVHAENGKIAVEMLADSEPGYFDLVFMDIQMPVMNGYEAAEAIRALGREGRPDLSEIPIIALTADAFNEDIQRARNAGMNSHMSKPMEIPTLVKTLDEWLLGK